MAPRLLAKPPTLLRRLFRLSWNATYPFNDFYAVLFQITLFLVRHSLNGIEGPIGDLSKH